MIENKEVKMEQEYDPFAGISLPDEPDIQITGQFDTTVPTISEVKTGQLSRDLSRVPLSFDEELRLDNTKRSSYKVCPRKFYLAHVLNIQSKNGSTALRFGSTWHGLMEGFYTGIKLYGWSEEGMIKATTLALELGRKTWDRESENLIYYPDYRTFEACTTMFMQYVMHFAFDNNMLEVIRSESVFACLIDLTSETEKRLFGHLPPVIFTGKLDLQLKLNEVPWIMEFKTTGFSLDIQVKRLNRNTQVLGYSYAAPQVLSFRPEGVLVSFAYASSRKGKDGNYGKLSIDFQRAPQVFAPQDFTNWKLSYLSTAANIYNDWKRRYFAMEFDACYNYNKPCSYTRICEGNRDIMKDGWTTEDVLTYYPDFIERRWDVEATGEED